MGWIVTHSCYVLQIGDIATPITAAFLRLRAGKIKMSSIALQQGRVGTSSHSDGCIKSASMLAWAYWCVNTNNCEIVLENNIASVPCSTYTSQAMANGM